MDTKPETPDDDGVILYDGDCLLCSRWVKWVVRHDPVGMFRFTMIASPRGRAMAIQLGIDLDDPETNAVIIDGRAHLYSDAALAISGRLPGYRWTRVLKAVPKPLRDAFYKMVARNRIRWFGRPEACDVPGPEIRARIMRTEINWRASGSQSSAMSCPSAFSASPPSGRSVRS
jgi:predicted DCC family thiol-disulfide oxidoreductase YuxK